MIIYLSTLKHQAYLNWDQGFLNMEGLAGHLGKGQSFSAVNLLYNRR